MKNAFITTLMLFITSKALFVLKIFKGNAQFVFLCNPQKSSVNAYLMKILKATATKKVFVCFYNLVEENFYK